MMIGGGEDNDHFVKSRKIYNYVKHLNEQGRVIPIMGICLGMQYMMMFESIDGSASMEFHMSWNETGTSISWKTPNQRLYSNTTHGQILN